MLPAWLGAGTALQKVVEDGKQSELEAMCRDWPFFSTRLGMLEMVFSKADLWLADYYDQRLVAKTLWPLGKELRDLLEEDIKVVLAIANRFAPDGRLTVDCGVHSVKKRLYRSIKRVAGRIAVSFRLTEEQGKSPDPRVEPGVDGHDCGRRRRYAQHRLTPKESRPHAVMWGRHEILLSSSSFFQYIPVCILCICKSFLAKRAA
ncbi:phosphoenolpyruvate carboxylase [Salmonella enterica subsp. enterica]|nr:phosphoenolpyruvate carboxylase [Salmonella enterica subsp. enterica]